MSIHQLLFLKNQPVKILTDQVFFDKVNLKVNCEEKFGENFIFRFWKHYWRIRSVDCICYLEIIDCTEFTFACLKIMNNFESKK